MKATTEQQVQQTPGEKANGCPVCLGPVEPSRTRPRIFCSHRCRTKAYELEGQIDSLVERLTKAQAQLQRVQAAGKV